MSHSLNTQTISPQNQNTALLTPPPPEHAHVHDKPLHRHKVCDWDGEELGNSRAAQHVAILPFVF